MDYARGIHCTQWFARADEHQLDAWGNLLTIATKRNHWFSAPDWSGAYCDGCKTVECKHQCLELPVRTVSEGTVLNHTTGKTVKFHDHYEYVAFLPGKPPRDLFDPEGFQENECKEMRPGQDLESANPAAPAVGTELRGTPKHPMAAKGDAPSIVAALGASTPRTKGGGSSSSSTPARTFGVVLLVGGILTLVGVAFFKLKKSRGSSSSYGVGVRGGSDGGGMGLRPPQNYDRTGSREVLRSSPDSSAI